MIRKQQILKIVSLAGAALFGVTTTQAQPGAQQPGGQQGRNQGRPNGPGGPMNPMNPMNGRADFRNLTMEQRRDVQEQVNLLTRQITLRLMLENAGITDKTTQHTIADFAAARDEAVQVLREKSRDLQMSLNDNATSPAQLAVLQNDYASAAEDEMTRRKKALALLDEKIGYSKQTRLKAALTILGLLGDSAALASNNNGGMGGFGVPGGFGGFGGPGGPGGFGGPGGEFGGAGGRGGRGGPQGNGQGAR